jgi:hydroxyacylglutathione hydrolase
MAGELNIEGFCLGPWQTNCYVVRVEGETDCWIVDAGFDPEAMIDAVGQRGLTPVRIVLTHAHLDHIAGLEQMRSAWPDASIGIHSSEVDFLASPELNLSAMMGMAIKAPPADDVFKHGGALELGGHAFEIRHTPGHSPGGITLYQPEARAAIVGDTLFAGSIGRYDFPTSDGPTLMRSIREQLLTLPDDVAVYPGHGPETTIGRERDGNPFL